jgi:hypothetical protein
MIVSSFLDKEPLPDIVSNALLYLTTVAGTFLYTFNVRTALLINAWKIISIVLFVVHLWLILKDRFDVLSGKDEEFRDKPPSARAVLGADLTTAAILLPALVINILYGFF